MTVRDFHCSLFPFFLFTDLIKKIAAAFLASARVIDYSLVVGVDAQSQQLVVGIVDYIRTYKLIEKIESFVKASTSSVEPTIVTPVQYKERFRSVSLGLRDAKEIC